MRVQGKKRKDSHTLHGRSVEKRSKDDIISSHQPEIRSYLSKEELQTLSKYDEKAIKPNARKRRSTLHCNECDNKFTSNDALQRHNSLKTDNIGLQKILPQDFKSNGSQIIVCRVGKCCYSTRNLKEIYRHDESVHDGENFPAPLFSNQSSDIRFISVIQILENIEDQTDNSCYKCMKNFATRKTLANHRPNCTGSQIHSCKICMKGFSKREEMIAHCDIRHRVDTSFKTTGVFVGVTRKHATNRNQKGGRGGCVYEKTFIPRAHNLTHTRQVLSGNLKSELSDFIKLEVIKNDVIRGHFVLECIISKPGEHGEKRLRWSTRSSSEVITSTSKIDRCINRWRVNVQRNLDKLMYIPSGFRCESIKSLTFVMGLVGNISGGCSNSGITGQINTNGASSRRGLTEVRGEDGKCFRDAVLCYLFSRDLYKKTCRESQERCKNHRKFCSCVITAEKKFKALQKKGSYLYL